MLTVGEHDSMWKDVMGCQIPNAANYIRILTNQIGFMNDLSILKELSRINVISDKEYAEALIDLGNHTGLWSNEEEARKLLDRVDKE